MSRVRWVAYAAFLAGVLGACGGEPVGQREGFRTGHGAIVGATGEEAPDADAADLTTESIAGTVARFGRCSGTLIGRQTLLTAAHCSDASTVRFAQSTQVFDVDSIERHDNWAGGYPYYDLAIVHLREPVPPTVVRNVAPLFLGEFQAAQWEGELWSNYKGLVVGYGRNNTCVTGTCEGQVNGAGIRRTGRVTGLKAWSHYLENRDIDYAREVAINKGDSGGPLFMKDEASGRYFVVGVNSALLYDDLDDDGFGPIVGSMWAMTGSSRWLLQLLDDSHPSWLVERLGPDVDDDGVLDQLDNCPPRRCTQNGLGPEACANPDQLDEDGDFVGDVCDNCPPSACIALGDGRSCTNSEQLDFDGDRVGDVCDPCSSNTRFASNEITNGGTVGDGCNQCRPKSPQHFLACQFGSTTCEDAKAGKCLSDFDAQGQPLPGWCSELADFDNDGIPDACDVCRLSADEAQRNLNSHIEEETGSTPLGDACDPVPVVRFSQYVPTFTTIEGVRVVPKDDLEVGAELQVFEARSWLGNDSTLLADDFSQNVNFRQCSCWDNKGDELPFEECFRKQCQPSGADSIVGGWRPMTLTLDTQGPDIPPSGLPLAFISGEYAESKSVIWRLHQDVEAEGEEKIESRNKVTTYGLVASVVDRQEAVIHASPRDQGAKSLRVVIDLVETPKGYYKDRRFIHQACLFSNCLGWVRPWEKYWNPPWDVRAIARFPFPIGPMTSFDAWLGRDGLSSDLGDLVAPRLREAVVSGAWAWNSFSEPSHIVERLGLEIQAVLVPRNGADAVAPVPVGIREGMFDFLQEPLPVAPGESDFSLSAGGRSVFSAVHQAVYVADEFQGDAVIRYDVNSGGSLVVAGTTLEHVGPVLGLAIDSSRNRLFILQAESEKALVSLTMHDLQRGDRISLLSVPSTGAFESTTIAVDSAGAVILARGDASFLTLWRYEVAENLELIFTGSRTEAGQLADTPLSGNLTVPLLWEGELSLLEPDAASFVGGEPCISL